MEAREGGGRGAEKKGQLRVHLGGGADRLCRPLVVGGTGKGAFGAPPASRWAAGWVRHREVGTRAERAWVVQLVPASLPPDHRTLTLLGTAPSPGDRPDVVASLDHATKSWSVR